MKMQIPYEGPKAKAVLAESSAKWATALQIAKSSPMLPEACFALDGVLGRTPWLPTKLPKHAGSIKGYSTWHNPYASCSLKERTEMPSWLMLRAEHRAICRLSSKSFCHWQGSPNQGVALITLAWAYILSADLASRQELRMEYRVDNATASPEGPPCNNCQIIHLDYATTEEVAWWNAICVPGVGWSIQDDQIAPWAVCIDGDVATTTLRFTNNNATSDQGPGEPPCASSAVTYLSKLCEAFGLGTDQLTAGLAAALAIAFNAEDAGKYPEKLELPRPRLCDRIIPAGTNWSTNIPDLFGILGRCMTLSLTCNVLSSALWGVFYDPNVPCNYSGAWLGPIVATIEPILRDSQLDLLAKVMATANPRLAPLWLGVTLCGKTEKLDSIVKTLTTRSYALSSWAMPNIDSAAWTCVPQSFMDLHPPGPRMDRNNRISRADVWRLRHAAHASYGKAEAQSMLCTPLCAWPPFGYMQAKDVELEIREHLGCSHAWVYAFWTWMPNGEKDDGFCLGPGPNHSYGEGKSSKQAVPPRQSPSANLRSVAASQAVLSDENIDELQVPGGTVGDILVEMSKHATTEVFRWCFNQVEKGFGGTVVPRPSQDFKAPRANRPHAFNKEAVWQWLYRVQEPEPSEGGI